MNNLFNVSENGSLLNYYGDEYVVYVPENVKVIHKNAFSGNKHIRKVVLNENVKVIQKEAFMDCYELEEVVLNEGLTSIGDYCFCDCIRLEKINFPSTLIRIGEYCFYNNGITQLVLDDNIIDIGRHAFDGNQNLKSVKLPNSIKSIRSFAFRGCEALMSIEIPNSVTTIQKYAFSECWNLKDVKLSQNLTYIGDSAFFECAVQKVVFPSTLTAIGSQAFKRCLALSHVWLGASIKKIGFQCFSYCPSLTDVSITLSILQMGKEVFAYCDCLSELQISGNKMGYDVDNFISFDSLGCGFVCDSFLDYLLHNFKYTNKNKTSAIMSAFKCNNISFFNRLVERGFIISSQIRDELISQAIASGKQDFLALLLEYKNSRCELEKEQRIEEKRRFNLLTENPSSVTHLRKIWKCKKIADGELKLVSYDGNDIEVEIPKSIGKNKIVAIDNYAFSPLEANIKNRETRKQMKSVKIPDSIRVFCFMWNST